MTRLAPARRRMKRQGLQTYTVYEGEATETVTEYTTITEPQPEVEVDVTETTMTKPRRRRCCESSLPFETLRALLILSLAFRSADAVMITKEAATPLATVTRTETDYAPTPVVTLPSTTYHAAAAPLTTQYENAPTPLTTSTVFSTNTLDTPSTTITSTAFAQSTACAEKVRPPHRSSPSLGL